MLRDGQHFVDLRPLGRRWDLKILGYRAIDDPAIDKDMRSLATAARGFTRRYRRKINAQQFDVPTVFGALVEYEQILSRATILRSFAELALAANVTKEREHREQRVTAWYYRHIEPLKWLRQAIGRLEQGQVAALLRSPSCDLARSAFIHAARRFRHHVGSDEQEKRATVLEYEWERLIDRWETLLAETEVVVRSSERSRIVTIDEAKVLLRSPDNVVRRDAAVGLAEAFKSIAPKVTRIYNRIIAISRELDRIRKFRYPESESFLSDQISRKSVSQMFAAIIATRSILKEFYELKRQHLRVRRMYWRDIWASIVIGGTIPYSQAQEMVLFVSRRFSPTFFKSSLMLFRGPYVDVQPRHGKYINWFASLPGPNLPPFIFGHYHGDNDSVESLFHEVGHGWEMDASSELGILAYDFTGPLLEFPSAFAEVLYGGVSVEQSQTETQRLQATFHRLDSAINIYQHTALYEFERAAHLTYRRRRKPLKQGELEELWIEGLQKAFSDAIHLDDLARYWWVHKTHLAYPFLLAKYPVGVLTAHRVSGRYHHEGRKRIVQAVERQFREGDLKTLAAALKPLGIDLASPTPWRQSIRSIGRLFRQAKRLHANLREEKVRVTARG